MRIVLAVDSLRLGGTEAQVARLAMELQARAHPITVLRLRAEGEALADELRAAGVTVMEAGAGWRRLVLPLRLRRLRPDVVHAFLLRPATVVLPAALLARVPRRVCGWRGLAPPPGQGARARRLLHTLAAWCAHTQTANAAAIAAGLPALARRRPLVVVPNGVELAETPADPGLEPPRGVIIANLLPYKGHLDLVRALALLPSPPRADWYGDGPERPALERALRAAGLDGTVRLHGSVPGAAAAYLSAQFALLASHEEGLPNALLEAMAAGLPCVATAVGGVPELVEHERTGLLVPPHDPPALAEAIQRLVDDAALRRKLGAAARERATGWSWPACVTRHLELYGAR